MSSYSIRKILKRDLKFAYKKADSLHINYFRLKNSRKFAESGGLLLKLHHQKFELIYFDEFKINIRNEKPYIWSKIGRRGYIKRSVDETKSSLIIAFSENKIYGVRPNDDTNDSTEFLSFINDVYHVKRDLYQEFLEKSIIICDNVSIHKTAKIRENLKNKKLLILTIWPYMPWLNAVEKLIGVI